MQAKNVALLCGALLSIALEGACGSSPGGDNGITDVDSGGSGQPAVDSGGRPASGDAGAITTNGNDAAVPLGQDASQQGSDAASGDDGAAGDDGSAASDGSAGDDGSATSDAGPFVPAPHPAFPIIANSGGPVLTAPQVVPVFFAHYDHTADVSKMVEGLPTATLASGVPFWSSAVSEYGVGPLKVLPAIQLTEDAPTTDTDPAAFLQGKMKDPAFAAVTSSTIIALFYPSSTPLSGSCNATPHGFGGYHDSFSNGSAQQPYAVALECANYGGLATTLDMVTVAGSHEIIEAATDPYPSSTPAYATMDDTIGAGFAMDVLLEGNTENGDLCTINQGFGRGPASFPYLLQRGWSNKAAKAGNLDPCSPDLLPDQPFVGAALVMPDTVSVQGTSGPGAVIPVGSSKTVEVDLFSFEPTADFTVLARQGVSVVPPTLTFTWDKTTGKNGDKLHLTIKSVSASQGGVETFLLQTELNGKTDPQKPAWAGVVTH